MNTLQTHSNTNHKFITKILISLAALCFVVMGSLTVAQEKPKIESIKEAKKRLLIVADSIDWSSVKQEQIEEVLKNAQKELTTITNEKQLLEVSVMSKSLRANLGSSLDNQSSNLKSSISESKDNQSTDIEIKSEDSELTILREKKEKKEIEIASLQRALKLLEKDSDLKEKALELSQLRQNQLYFGGGAILLFLSLISFNLYRGNNRKKKLNDLLAEEKERTEIERDKSESLLLNILPKPVADELKTKGKASVKYYEMASVIFTDFKGFTTFAEKMTPVELVEELEKCFTGFDEIMARHRLEKIKTIGDAYMGVGGVPEANKDNPINVVLAGLDIQRFMENKKAKHQAEGGDYWDLRLGINSGELIAGVIGKSKFAYDVWGDTVNTASRMESSGEIAKVNISGNTYELVKDFFECTYRGRVNAKNKGEMDMYFVDRIKPELSEQGQGRVPNEDFSELMKQKGLKA